MGVFCDQSLILQKYVFFCTIYDVILLLVKSLIVFQNKTLWREVWMSHHPLVKLYFVICFFIFYLDQTRNSLTMDGIHFQKNGERICRCTVERFFLIILGFYVLNQILSWSIRFIHPNLFLLTFISFSFLSILFLFLSFHSSLVFQRGS